MTTATPEQFPHQQNSSGASPSHILLGALLVLLGIGWLVQATMAVHIPWDVALPIVLVLIGVALVVGAGSGGMGWLIGPGIVISLVLAFLTAIPMQIGDSPANQVEHPLHVSEVATPYHLGAGTLTLDLQDLRPDQRELHLTGTVGAGKLIVRVPESMGIQVNSHVGAGSVTFLSQEQDGFGISQTFTSPDYATASQRLVLDLSVGFGEIEVRR
jgi:hypothetical protein